MIRPSFFEVIMNVSNSHSPATLGGDTCPVCLRPVFPLIDVGAFRLFFCRECECLCSDALARRAATTFVPAKYFAHEGTEERKWKSLIQRLQLAAQPVRSVLDVGCGRGAFLSFLRAQYPEVMLTGIELDAERADQSRRAVPDANIYTGDVQNVFNAINGSFDLITLWDVFEHLPQPRAVLNALAGKLSENGCIFIQTIHEPSVVPMLGRLSYQLSGGRFRGLARRTHEAHHLVFFTRKGLGILARDANLEIRDLWFDRLFLARMDGNRLMALGTSMLLALENALGNGLFVDIILKTTIPAPSSRTNAAPSGSSSRVV
jgi:2-polyprenyl-3-methyl-5-hydroxy-6-metoxy-1,4-benzoquinol methylase